MKPFYIVSRYKKLGTRWDWWMPYAIEDRKEAIELQQRLEYELGYCAVITTRKDRHEEKKGTFDYEVSRQEW